MFLRRSALFGYFRIAGACCAFLFCPDTRAAHPEMENSVTASRPVRGESHPSGIAHPAGPASAAVDASPEGADSAKDSPFSFQGQSPSYGVDAVLMHAASPDPSGRDTQLQTRFGARIRHRVAEPFQWFWAREANLWLSHDRRGTSAAAVDRNAIGGEARLVGGRVWGTRFFRVAPYSLVYGGGSVGWLHLQAGEDSRVQPTATLALGFGGGLEYALGSVDMRVEMALGMRNERPELLSAISIGWGNVLVRGRDEAGQNANAEAGVEAPAIPGVAR